MSYQNFIATISNTMAFNLISEDKRKVRLTPRQFIVQGGPQNREILSLNSNNGLPVSFVLKDIPNTDNFNLFVQARNGREFPVNIVTSDAGEQFLTVGSDITTPLRINPAVQLNPPVVVQFAAFTAVVGLSPQIKVDELDFLRLDGNFPIVRFGFEAIMATISIRTAANWRQILPFIFNGGTIVGTIELAEVALLSTVIGSFAGAVLIANILGPLTLTAIFLVLPYLIAVIAGGQLHITILFGFIVLFVL